MQLETASGAASMASYLFFLLRTGSWISEEPSAGISSVVIGQRQADPAYTSRAKIRVLSGYNKSPLTMEGFWRTVRDGQHKQFYL